ncbi:NtaA/DmoA family FMN-dependent monooxygenase [Kitasatospora sp. NPDC090091]|uniref:NtaA/DmoA family FMN-dependent monooxygenase n=1 Tax=Kitasatospora sp. NPDC090091 TaxID=3364081 RepID=UPI00381B4578
MPAKQIHLATILPGIGDPVVWSDPRAGSQIDFASFTHLARTAERGRFDFFFLAEGLRLREHKGELYEQEVAGRPEALTVLSALAAVTSRIGLAATVNSTFNEPYEVARRLASLDHLSEGRAAWNVVTSWDEFTGENFRRGGFLAESDRYTRATEFLQTARELWDSWADGDVLADQADGRFLRPAAGRFTHTGRHFDITGRFNTPRPPQGHPVIIQAGESAQGREFAAADADVIFSKYGELAEAQEFYRDVKGRLAAYGRSPEQLKILPYVTFVLGDTTEEAHEQAAEFRRQRISPQKAISYLEAFWGRDLSGYDPDGPLPEIDPDPDNLLLQGHSIFRVDRAGTVRKWRTLASERGLSIRELVTEVTGRQNFVGTPREVADAMDAFVQNDGADGYILAPHVVPGGLDDFVDRVVPLLQEKGVHRTEYTGSTLRDHLGLTAPRPAPAQARPELPETRRPTQEATA